MYLRAKSRATKDGVVEHLMLVESFRENGRVRQRVVLSFGRVDELVASGQAARLAVGFAKVAQIKLAGEAAQRLSASSSKAWGPVLVFRRLWEEQGLPELIRELSQGRRFRFDLEAACFALALQRLCEPGSDLQGSKWLQTVHASGFEGLELQHLYRAVEFLSGVEDQLQQKLFAREHDLFNNSLDLLFIDTTSLYAHRDGTTDLVKFGHSRDHRNDLPQLVLCVAVDRHGWPVAWDVLPGNTADVNAMQQMVDRLRTRMRIGQVVVVADRGMISKKMLKSLEEGETPFQYVLGCRMRKVKDVMEVLRSIQLEERMVVQDNLQVAERVLNGRRYVVCHNPAEARNDAAAREATVARLGEMIAGGRPGDVILHRGYKRFLRVDKESFELKPELVEQDQLYDGNFVLTTNTELSAAEVARAYKGLWRVERTFRKQKSTLDVRPLYHQRDDMCRGHIAASFLALRLEVDLQRRLDRVREDLPATDRRQACSWPDLMRDLSQVSAIRVQLDDQEYLLRTNLSGDSHLAFRAAGVRPPPTLTKLSDSPGESSHDTAKM